MDIIYSRQAIKFLLKQPKFVRKRIVSAIETLPRGDVRKLSGMDGYRLRVGDFRVIFTRDGQIIEIIKIDNRGQVYRR